LVELLNTAVTTSGFTSFIEVNVAKPPLTNSFENKELA